MSEPVSKQLSILGAAPVEARDLVCNDAGVEPENEPGAAGTGPLIEIIDEARRVLDAATQQDVPLRLLGGLAVHFRAKDLPDALRRPYKDIDLATPAGDRRPIVELFSQLGYTPADRFNAFNGHRRLLFHDTVNSRQVDIFVGSFSMCHAIPLGDRITLQPETIPVAELLLTKLQVVQLNEKDLRDLVALLHEHDVADHDDDAINAQLVASLASIDWGLWRTLKMNLERVREGAANYRLAPEAEEVVIGRVDRLWEAVEAEPKSAKWKLRSRVGDRKRWYEEPDEVG